MTSLTPQQNSRKIFFCFDIDISKMFSPLLLGIFFMISGAWAQVPVLSYASPQVYTADIAISPLSPTNTGGAVPTSTPITLSGTFNNLTGLAIDASGNVYVAENGNNDVREIPAAGGSVLTLGSGFNQPCGVTVDAAGNVYVTDFGNNAIKKIPVGNGTVVTVASGLGGPYGIAIDAAGNIYFSEFTAGDIKKIPAGSSTPAVIGSGFSDPTGIALDATGNIYLTDRGHNAIKKILASNGTVSILSAGSGNPNGVTVDASGNVYFADTNLTTITEIPVGGSSNVAIGSGFSNPTCVLVDAKSDIFVGDQGNSVVKEIAIGAYKISPALPAGLSFDIGTGIISGTPTVTAPATNYTVTATNGSGSGTAVVNITISAPAKPIISYSTPQVYVVPQTITPLSPVSSGGPIPPTAAFAISPALPSGLSLDVNTGIIIGTPSTGVPATNYTVTATNAGGSGTAVIDITVNLPAKPIISYTTPQAYVVMQAITPLSPVSSGGTIPSTGAFSISPALPAGLNLDNSTGVISGTPTIASAATNYTVTATNAGGGGTAIIAITVGLPPKPAVSYTSPQVYNPLIAIAPLTPTNTGGPVPAPTAIVVATGFSNITGIAIDSSGVFYVADNGNSRIVKYSNGAGLILGSGFNHPTGVALDAAGNIYVADNGNNAVKEIPAGGGAVITLGSGFNSPYGIAVDASGNVYVSDLNNNEVKKIPAGNGAPVIVRGGFNQPAGIAIDAAGNIYVADRANNAIKEIPVAGGAVITLGTGNGNPNGVAVDASGNVYFADTKNTSIIEIPANRGASFAVGGGLSTPQCVSLDKNGGIYAESGNNNIEEVQRVGYNITPNLPNGLSFSRSTGSITGTPTQISAATNYSVTATNYGGSSTAIVNIAIAAAEKPDISYSTPQYYTVGTPVSLAPVNNGGVIPLQTPLDLASGLPDDVMGIAVDKPGNVYAALLGASVIRKISPAGKETTVGSGFDGTIGVAIDGAGNLFITDSGNKVVKEILASNGTVITYASGFSYPSGIAIDGSGNLYVSDVTNKSLYKVAVGGGTPTVIVSGLNSPAGVAIDPSGNLYVANRGDNTVREVPAGTNTLITIGSGFSKPYGVAVDPVGNVFVTDEGNGAVKRIPVGGGAPVSVALSVGFKEPSAITLDASGNIYAADWTKKAIYEINPGYFINLTLPPGLSLDESTGIISGTPATVSPKTNYSISGRNSGGVSVATVEITINPYQLPAVSYTSPQVYATNTAITPLVPKSSGVLPVGVNRNAANVAVTLNNNQGIAVDAAGNIYVAESGNNEIVKITAAGSNILSLGSGFSSPSGVAVDAAGNVYVADYGNKAVKKITPGGAVTILGSGFNRPYSVAVDGAGNVYVADLTNGVEKIPAGNGAPVGIGTGITGPIGVAVDGYGNVYVLANAIYEILASNGNTITIASGTDTNNISLATNIAVDVFGNIYYNVYYLSYYDGDPSESEMFEIPAGTTTSVGFNFGVGFPFSPVFFTFDKGGVLYVSAQNTGAIVKSTPASGYYISQVLPLGLNLNPNTGIISGTPTATSPATNYTVTGYNTGGSAAATVNIKTVAVTNTSLTNLAVSSGTLSPSFAAGTTSYSVKEPYATSSITVTPTAGDGTASILLNGAAVASGTPSAAIPLNVGPNIIGVTVTDNGGTTVSNYTLTATRIGSPGLISLTISAGTLSPAFSRGTLSYTTTLPAGIGAISITPTLADSTGTITINGKSVATGTASPNIQLAIGSNTITIVGTASDGITKQTYTLTVIRPSANALLASLHLSNGTISPAFTGATYNYTVAVANSVTSITLTPTTADPNATVTVNGTAITSGNASAPINLSIGANVILVVVTAQDGSTTKTYTLTVNRPGTNNANLSVLATSRGALSPVFNTATTSYTASVVNGVTSTTVTPTTSDPDATVSVNGTAVTSGTASGAIPLAVGVNSIGVTVTASNGTSTKTYTIKITRAGSANANLSAYKISNGTLTPAFNEATTSYTANVANTVTSIAVTPTTADATAAVKVRGTVVTSGSASAPVALSVGANTINTIVTAQDGTTTKTYVLTVTRAAAPADSFDPGISATKPTEMPGLNDDGILVHQGVSPNGDGINDFLQIDNISQYPDNTLMIINRNGQLIYEAKGYDNSSKVFDGHSNKNGQMQLPGTYFYQLDYTVKGIARHKTGFIVLKY